MLLTMSAPALASSPELHAVYPTGVQRGTDAQLVLKGARLGDAQSLLLYRPGVEVKAVHAESADSVKVDVHVADDCPLGEHPLRLRTATGISELRTFYVGALPVVAEKENNSDFATPQAVALNTTVAGVITNEDVDYFAVQAEAGQRVTAEIEAMRLGRAMFDPSIAILDAKRFELAACDDSALLLQDSVVSIVAPAAGTYTVRVAEASFGGGDDFHYRLHIGTFPRPTICYPPGGAPGEALKLQLLGDVSGPQAYTASLPAEPSRSWPLIVEDNSGASPSPLLLRVNALPNSLEVEPNSKREEATEQHTPPCALNGIIDKPGDYDVWRFAAKRGQPLDIELLARRLRSPLDSVLAIHDGSGKQIAADDDTRKPDSYLRFDPPADGDFFLVVRDHLMRGGADYVYRVEVAPPRPRVNTYLPKMSNQQPQYRQAIPIPRGNRCAMLVRALRQNCGGDVHIEPDSLPAGVAIDGGLVPDGQDVAPVVFSADDQAELAGALVDMRGRIAREPGDITGGFVQDIPLVRANPNNTAYYTTWVDRAAVAVTEKVPFRVSLVEPPVPLVRSGRLNLRVVAERGEGFAEPIEVRMLWNPPGVSSPTKIDIPKEADHADYVLNAAGNAQVHTWPVAVIARAKVGDGDVWVSSQLVHLAVSEPYVTGQIQMAATPRGQPASVLCKLEQHKPFEGAATIRLVNLPPKTKAEPLQVTASDTQAVFEVATEPDAPVGQHKNLFCELVITQNGAPIVHRIAQGGVLRIDNPPPAPVEKPVAKKPPEPAKRVAQAPKPMSRLEQLRKAAAEQAKTTSAEGSDK